ncbi:Polyadenylate-binding protein 1-b-binding protein [Heracleum sosnowskyi]|uniref:Polyadenylate-binding protein 1-b-binding protein n=1 Tax=Heracleum sosnowskyi TaxID=360622 RepID=A0AAD8JI41_9APIA|nr:Polyadenylate-binding protein 1-b-binding protein [Heracleum sosnowskyi]
MQVVSKVWKRLMITSMFNFVIYFALFIGALLAIILWPVTLALSATGITVAIILLVYFMGVLYISFVCHLANVISVLEDVHGIEAIVKSKSLIKGNTGLCAAFFLIHNLCLLGIHLGFYKATAVGGDSFWDLMLLTFLWSMLMSMLILFGLVIQIIIYFNCKSYHGENIYVQVDSKDVEFKLFR